MTSTVLSVSATSQSPYQTTMEALETMRIPSQGRLSTLSSVVRPTPTTATRTVAITREVSRLDTLETATRLMGSTSLTPSVPRSITMPVIQEHFLMKIIMSSSLEVMKEPEQLVHP